jgi:hypothetical protein
MIHLWPLLSPLPLDPTHVGLAYLPSYRFGRGCGASHIREVPIEKPWQPLYGAKSWPSFPAVFA